MGRPVMTTVSSLIEFNVKKVLGVECASAYWGLSTFNPEFVIDLFEYPMSNECYLVDGATHTLFVPDINRDNLVNITSNLKVTDREQTICDMIRFNRHEFHLYECIDSAYVYGMVDIDRLENLARQYSIYDRLQDLIVEAENAYIEDNE